MLAHIRGQVAFDGARLSSENGWALNAYGLQADVGISCSERDGKQFEASGRVSLLAANVGELMFLGACLSNKNGLALDAHTLRVARTMNCRVDATGGVGLVRAHIGTLLVAALTGAIRTGQP
jgi:hypothetical protein